MQTISRKTVIIGLIGVTVVAFITIGLLLFLSKMHTKTPDADMPSRPTAAAIITEFKAKSQDNTFIAGGVLSLIDDKNTQPIYVSDSELDKYVQVQTPHLAIITKAAGFSNAEVATISSNVKKVFISQSLAFSSTKTTNTILFQATSDIATCQLTTATTSAPYIELRVLCSDINDNKEALTTINQLIALWPSAQSTNYDLVSQETTIKKDQKVAIVSVMQNDYTNPHRLIYVYSAGSWKYIADGTTGTAVEKNERFVINADIKKGFDNSEYGVFLHSVLFS